MNIPIDEQRNTLNALANQGVQHFPVVREVVADFETPLSCYAKVASGPYSYLLESANQGGEKWSRYSMIGLPARRVYKIRGLTLSIEEAGETVESRELIDPFQFVSETQARYGYPIIEGYPQFTGGLVGYFGYDTVRYVEPRLANSTPPETINTPDILLMLSEDVIVFDNVKGKVQLITHVSDLSDDQFLQAELRLDAMQGAMLGPLPKHLVEPSISPAMHESDFQSSYGQDSFWMMLRLLRSTLLPAIRCK